MKTAWRRRTLRLSWDNAVSAISAAFSNEMNREHIPAHERRAILVEAGHRCAIPTCRATTTEIAHIIPWAETRDDSPENLIALCPNCHTRFDKKEIDRNAMRMYKRNLGIISNRYSELERRIFEEVFSSGKRVYTLGAGGDILCAHAVKDEFLEYRPEANKVWSGVEIDGQRLGIPTVFAYWVTDKGMEFIRKYCSGEDIG